MTTRHKGYVVALKSNIREDDAQALIEAIGLLRGVLSVTPVEADISDSISEQRVRHELGQALLDVVYPERKERT